MQVDSQQIEEKVLMAAGEVTEDKLTEPPKPAEIIVLPKRNENANRPDQVYLVEDLLTTEELQHLNERFCYISPQYVSIVL